MDTKLFGGDHAADSRGLPVAVYGVDEIIQRALIRLSVKKGSFAYDKTLGSELHRLCGAGEAGERLAIAYAQEALAPLHAYLSVISAEFSHPQPDVLLISVIIEIDGKKYILEVKK